MRPWGLCSQLMLRKRITFHSRCLHWADCLYISAGITYIHPLLHSASPHCAPYGRVIFSKQRRIERFAKKRSCGSSISTSRKSEKKIFFLFCAPFVAHHVAEKNHCRIWFHWSTVAELSPGLPFTIICHRTQNSAGFQESFDPICCWWFAAS